jgi:hypothetical protein
MILLTDESVWRVKLNQEKGYFSATKPVVHIQRMPPKMAQQLSRRALIQNWGQPTVSNYSFLSFPSLLANSWLKSVIILNRQAVFLF